MVLYALLYQLRMQQVRFQVQSRLEERVSERERIARELHDTLLQGFQGLMLRLQAVADRVRSDRDRVKDLRANERASLDLSEVFLRAWEDPQPHPCKLRVTVEGAPRKLHQIVKEEVERIGIEAMHNAQRHARASEIEIGIAFLRRRFELRISDDGIGIDPNFLIAGREGHYGVKGMRERAKRIRGTLSIASRPNGGTEVGLVIPAAIAYVSRAWKIRSIVDRTVRNG